VLIGSSPSASIRTCTPAKRPKGCATSTTRTWATWRATAAETRAAPRTARQSGPGSVPLTRRPEPIEPIERTFLESGWAALLVAIGFLVLLALAVVAGKLA
jgi:hypothetical protein